MNTQILHSSEISSKLFVEIRKATISNVILKRRKKFKNIYGWYFNFCNLMIKWKPSFPYKLKRLQTTETPSMIIFLTQWQIQNLHRWEKTSSGGERPRRKVFVQIKLTGSKFLTMKKLNRICVFTNSKSQHLVKLQVLWSKLGIKDVKK